MALFFALGRFLGACGASCNVFWPAWLVFMRLGTLRARIWRGQRRSGEGFGGSNGLFFQVFSCFRMHTRWRCAKAPDVQKPQFFRGFSEVLIKSQMLRARQKTAHYRSSSLSNRALHQNRAPNPSWSVPGSTWEGSETVLGASWTSLG